MSKIKKAKYKIDRKYQANIWGSSKSSFEKKKYRPGQHGKTKKKISDYGIQLREKQILKSHYSITDKQLKSTYLKASSMKGNKESNLVNLLERRMDAVVYRCKFASTIHQSRQMVNHGYFLVNNKKVDYRSYLIKIGDKISLSCEKYQNQISSNIIKKERNHPVYLEVDKKQFTCSLIRNPDINTIPYPYKINFREIIGWYSKIT